PPSLPPSFFRTRRRGSGKTFSDARLQEVVVVGSRSASSFLSTWSQHRLFCPSPIANRPGSSVRQIFIAYSQRGANRQPVGICFGLGTLPGIEYSRSARWPKRGIDWSKPWV